MCNSEIPKPGNAFHPYSIFTHSRSSLQSTLNIGQLTKQFPFNVNSKKQTNKKNNQPKKKKHPPSPKPHPTNWLAHR